MQTDAGRAPVRNGEIGDRLVGIQHQASWSWSRTIQPVQYAAATQASVLPLLSDRHGLAPVRSVAGSKGQISDLIERQSVAGFARQRRRLGQQVDYGPHEDQGSSRHSGKHDQEEARSHALFLDQIP